MIPLADTSVPPDINALLAAANRGLQAIPQRQPENRHRRVVHRGRRAGPRTFPAGQGLDRPGHRRAQESGPADRADRPIASRCSTRRPTRPTPFRRGRRTWPPSPRSCRPTTRGRRASSTTAARPLDEARATVRAAAAHAADRAGQPSQRRPGGGHLPDPTSNSCWCCCPKASPSMQAGIIANRTPSRHTRACTWASTSTSTCRHHAPPDSCRPSSSGSPTFEDYPDRPAGDLYCRVPQDSSLNVRGARNYSM